MTNPNPNSRPFSSFSNPMPLIKPMKSAAATIFKNLFGEYQTSNQVKGEDFRLPLLKQGLTLAAGLSILMLIELRPARADLIICNQSNMQVSIAYMYHKSSNDAWTASGWKNIDNNNCFKRLDFDLNETVYFHARVGGINGRTTHPVSGTTTSFCVDTEDPFEILWDGDNSNPYYKDLRLLSGRGYEPCENISPHYKEVPFAKIDSENHDHCVVALGESGRFVWQCWD